MVAVFCGLQTVSLLLRQYMLFYDHSFGLVMRKATTSLLYQKLLRLSPRAVARTTTGKIINLASGDIAILEKAFFYLSFLIIAPLVFVLCVIPAALQVRPLSDVDRMEGGHSDCDGAAALSDPGAAQWADGGSSTGGLEVY